jgi:murein endopeptidase
VIFFSLFFAYATAHSAMSDLFEPCDPESIKHFGFSTMASPTLDFCQKWNPDFRKGGSCCAFVSRRSCFPRRGRPDSCSNVTEEQKIYINTYSNGNAEKILQVLTDAIGQKQQAYCSVNNGFLAYGRPLIQTPFNALHIQAPGKCTYFGTDPMVAMLEWVGREIRRKYSNTEYSQAHLLLGDIAGPRGGCLVGKSGRRKHASHMTGQDVDVGFLTPIANRPSPTLFHTKLNVEANAWFLKQIFNNPFACIKGVLLSQNHIKTLNQYFKNDSEWPAMKKYIKHVKGHNNHFHIRIGNGPGPFGCTPGAKPEFEFDEEDELEPAELMSRIEEELDALKQRRSP